MKTLRWQQLDRSAYISRYNTIYESKPITVLIFFCILSLGSCFFNSLSKPKK